MVTSQPSYYNDGYSSIVPSVCNALLNLTWAPFDMLLRVGHPAAKSLATSQEGRQVLNRFPSFYQHFLRSAQNTLEPIDSAARQHFEACVEVSLVSFVVESDVLLYHRSRQLT